MAKADLGMTEMGDLLLSKSPDGTLIDFSLVYDENALKQSVDFRLKTNIKELFMHQEIGNELVEIIGERNTKETAQKGINYIINAITLSNYVTKEQVDVSAIPTDASTIVFIINIEYQLFKTFKIVLEVNLQDGIRRVF